MPETCPRSLLRVPTTFTERLRIAFAASGVTRAQLAAVLRSPNGTRGVSVSSIGQLLSGTSKSMNAENAARAARFLGVNYFWLCTGEGDMRGNNNPTSVEQALDVLADALAELSPAEREPAAEALKGWARSGGAGPWRAMFSALFRHKGKQRHLAA